MVIRVSLTGPSQSFHADVDRHLQERNSARMKIFPPKPRTQIVPHAGEATEEIGSVFVAGRPSGYSHSGYEVEQSPLMRGAVRSLKDRISSVDGAGNAIGVQLPPQAISLGNILVRQ